MRVPIVHRPMLIGSLMAAWLLSGCGGKSAVRSSWQPNYNSFTGTAAVSTTRGAIQGVLLDQRSVPVPGATVTVNNARRAPSTYFSVTTGSNGEYTIGNVEPGTYSLSASLPGIGEATGRPVTVLAGQIATVPGVTLDGSMPPTKGRIIGKVTASGGQPIEGASVRVVHETHTGEATTSATGGYTIGSLPPGTYQVTATKAGFEPASAQATVVAGQDATLDVTVGMLGSRTYVGSSTCRGCHYAIYDQHQKSGHPYKLTRVVNGVPPTLPFSLVPQPPAGYSWSDVTYMIGGYGWKARFTDRQGYIVTGSAVQYNMANHKWSGYNPTQAPGTKPYDCGACHTTGWVPTGSAGPHQDNLPGMHGTFAETGIGCEACHGPGGNHIITRSRGDIELDRSSEACGACHFRDSQHRVQAKVANGKGFIEHHEQYDEIITAGHAGLKCVDCHNPHKSTINKQGGVTRTCQSCHAAQATKMKHGSFTDGPTCIDCHMPKASKSAVNRDVYQADLRTHIFKVKTAPVGQSDMWYAEGNGTYSRGHVTLDFACYGCHKDEAGVGGTASVKTLIQLSQKAEGMHQ